MKPPSALRRAHYGWLALGFVVLVVYGSLVPFEYQELPFAQALAHFRDLLAQGMGRPSRSDFVANVLLFVPLGFLLMGALCVDRSRLVAPAAALLVLPCCGALSLAVEFAQQWFPARTTAVSDVVGETLGAGFGVVAWLAAGPAVTNWARRLLETDRRDALPGRLLAAYLAVLVLVHVLPLDLTLSPADLYHKYRDGLIQLVPFKLGAESTWAAVQKTVWNFTYFLPVGWLLAHLPSPAWRDLRQAKRVFGLGLLLAGGIEFLQLFVLSRHCSITDVLTGSLAVVVGWAVPIWAGKGGVMAPRLARQEVHTPRSSGTLRWLLVTAWVALLVFTNWQPFDFFSGSAGFEGRARSLTFVPFADTVLGDYLNAYEQVVLKVVQFAPLGALLTPAGGSGYAAGLLVAVVPAAVLAVVLEVGQLFLPSRTPSFTDVLVETGGAWLGFVLARRFARAAAA